MTSSASVGTGMSADPAETYWIKVPNRPVYFALKRAADVVVSFAMLIIAAPIMALIALAIRLDSPGSILFPQVRVGRGGVEFVIYKFRSMYAVAPAYTLKVSSSDPRVTRVGRFLRLSGLDELPQLWNVLRGEMSLIGPRPELRFIVEMYEPWQQQRHLVTPGITGWWQVHHRNEVPMHHGIDFDLHYIEQLGPVMDLKIVVRTLVVMLSGAQKGLTIGRSARPETHGRAAPQLSQFQERGTARGKTRQ
ncbi:MAG: sugar transferase [Candidatus Dormibacteria bacterium]